MGNRYTPTNSAIYRRRIIERVNKKRNKLTGKLGKGKEPENGGGPGIDDPTLEEIEKISKEIRDERYLETAYKEREEKMTGKVNGPSVRMPRIYKTYGKIR